MSRRFIVLSCFLTLLNIVKNQAPFPKKYDTDNNEKIFTVKRPVFLHC